MWYTILILLCPWFSREEFRELPVEVNKVLCIFSSFQFVLIDMVDGKYSIKRNVKSDGIHSLFSAMKVLPSLSTHASTSKLKSKIKKVIFNDISDILIPKLWLSFMLAFIPCPKKRFRHANPCQRIHTSFRGMGMACISDDKDTIFKWEFRSYSLSDW